MKHERQITHLDLFSGIGGFALATELVWPSVEHTFCDIEPFAQAVLRKHWPQAKIHGDIRTLTADAEYTRHASSSVGHSGEEPSTRRKEKPSSSLKPTRGYPSTDLLTGGFPCQPFSQAGRRLGTEDDRHLWPEMLRVIREFHPRWVVGENVGGFVTWNDGMVLEQVHTDLEGEGYEVQAFIIPAVSVNAPHRRDRVWIVAHSRQQHEQGDEQRVEAYTAKRSARTTDSERQDKNDTDAECQGREGSGGQDTGRLGFSDRHGGYQGGSWDKNWVEVAARLCTLDDGLPNGLARPRGWRNAALKGAGNAIVPQVAEQIFRAIKECDEYLQ